jgi:hypothetical protein
MLQQCCSCTLLVMIMLVRLYRGESNRVTLIQAPLDGTCMPSNDR